MDPVFQFLSADLKQRIFLVLIAEDFSRFRNYHGKSRDTRIKARIKEIVTKEVQLWLAEIFDSGERAELLKLLEFSIENEYFYRHDLEICSKKDEF